ncbi:hypothetical protein [Armatimonas rosea]|uniref:Uncharacterized protein n=1 Tax=Armatimonas rosea TaxID=685828 RepID=A0A7W9SVR7_ARMRO|nr:hypothetical protein [Armatimonas rosea]MBB6053288.1 hypothetical protein [Armatimonas rosea]
MNPDEELKIKLSTEFGGMDDAAKYAAALRNVANEEGNLARASRRAAKVLAESAKVKQDAIKATGSNAPAPNYYQLSRNEVIGPHTRLGLLQQRLAEATAQGADDALLKDLRLKVRRTQRLIDRSGEGIEGLNHEAIGQAILTSRFNAGPFQPLAGRALRATLTPERAAELAKSVAGLPGGKKLAETIEGLAGSNAASVVGKLVTGPAGVAALGLLGVAKASKAFYEAEFTRAEKTSALTQKLTESMAAFGDARTGSLGQMIGGPGAMGNAFAFQNRIGTDPLARAAAARLGISDLAAPYGKIDPGKEYIEAIKKLSREGDEMVRRRTARILGIEREVERYRLLSPETKKAMELQSRMEGIINDVAQQKNAGEFDAAQKRLENAKNLFDTAKGKGFSRGITDLMNRESNALELLAGLADAADKIGVQETDPTGLLMLQNPAQALGVYLGNKLGQKIQGGISGGEQGGKSETQKNTEAMKENTQAMMRLNKNIGETEGSRSALGKMRGDQIFDAYLMGALQMGAF